jgi:hypothetical protein
MRCGPDCQEPTCGRNKTPKGRRPKAPAHNPAPEFFGYDENAVSAVKCLVCDQAIGEQRYKEVRTLSRFGQMLFECLACWSRENAAQLCLPHV